MIFYEYSHLNSYRVEAGLAASPTSQFFKGGDHTTHGCELRYRVDNVRDSHVITELNWEQTAAYHWEWSRRHQLTINPNSRKKGGGIFFMPRSLIAQMASMIILTKFYGLENSVLILGNKIGIITQMSRAHFVKSSLQINHWDFCWKDR